MWPNEAIFSNVKTNHLWLSSRAIKQEIDASRTGYGKRHAPNFEKKVKKKKETELVISRFFLW